MASLINRGRKFSIRFTAPDGKRRTIAAGTTSKPKAENLARKVDSLIALSKNGISPLHDPQIAPWLRSLDVATRKRLENVGLLSGASKGPGETRLFAVLDDYVVRKSLIVKPSTMLHISRTVRNLKEHFGDIPVAQIGKTEAVAFSQFLRENRGVAKCQRQNRESLAPATIRKTLSNSRMIFEDLVEMEIVRSNPFKVKSIKVAAVANRSRDHFISQADATKLLAACPDDEWRAIIALARYGGLRIPSELLALRLDDIDWVAKRIRIRSQKTAHHEGKDERVIPLFPELIDPLRAVVHAAVAGQETLITRYRFPNQNLRTLFKKIIRRAGLRPWDKLFQNLRASRATELTRDFSEYVVAKWIGHSVTIARKHYWQVDDAAFDRATGSVATSAGPVADVATFVASTMLHETALSIQPESTIALSGTDLHYDVLNIHTDRPGGIRTPDQGIMSPLL